MKGFGKRRLRKECEEKDEGKKEREKRRCEERRRQGLGKEKDGKETM